MKRMFQHRKVWLIVAMIIAPLPALWSYLSWLDRLGRSAASPSAAVSSARVLSLEEIERAGFATMLQRQLENRGHAVTVEINGPSIRIEGKNVDRAFADAFMREGAEGLRRAGFNRVSFACLAGFVAHFDL